MKVIKSKKPYLFILVIFFLIAAMDSILWSEKAKPMVIEVEKTEETTTTPNSTLNFALNNRDE